MNDDHQTETIGHVTPLSMFIPLYRAGSNPGWASPTSFLRGLDLGSLKDRLIRVKFRQKWCFAHVEPTKMRFYGCFVVFVELAKLINVFFFVLLVVFTKMMFFELAKLFCSFNSCCCLWLS